MGKSFHLSHPTSPSTTPVHSRNIVQPPKIISPVMATQQAERNED